MFGHNEIVGKRFFKDQPEGKLLVTSRFFTLQGEGPYRGKVAAFVRLAKCNLACSFCDTYFDSGELLSYDDIFDQLEGEIESFYRKRNSVHDVFDIYKNTVLVITGGEPSLQSSLKGFLDKSPYHFSQIESNGITLAIVPEETTYVVSPKCLETNGIAVRYLKPNKTVLDRADCLKFVVSAPEYEQYSAYSVVPEWALEWKNMTGKEIFVSPMNIYLDEPLKAKQLRASKETGQISIQERSSVDEVISFWEPGLLDMPKNQRNHEYAGEYCMLHGLTLNLQSHLYVGLA